jgi:transcriptional regulator with XRE-family HTH domain
MGFADMERHRKELEDAGYFKELGRRVRKARQERGWTLDDLEEKTSIAANTLGKLERGDGNPRLSTLVEVSLALKVPLSRLVPPAPRDRA